MPALLITLSIPDANDLAEGAIDKHDRLSMGDGRKMVFVGGSNLMYGLDSQAIEERLGYRVINMGMNSYLGVRYMLNEVRPEIRQGDVVVLCFEYINYVGEAPVDGWSTDLLAVIKARPQSALYLQGKQPFQVLTAIPTVAQQKLFRMIREGLSGAPTEDEGLMDRIEARAGLNRFGDLTSHEGLTWPFEMSGFEPLDASRVDRDALRLIAEFRTEMERRGARVFLVPPPVAQSYFDQNTRAIRGVVDELRKSTSMPMSDPGEYSFPDSLFFDYVYHLTKAGKHLRTGKVIDELTPALVAEKARH